MRLITRERKLWLQILLAISALYLFLRHLGPAFHHVLFQEQLPPRLNTSKMTSLYPLASNLTINLVVASVKTDSIAWTTRLQELLPNLRVIRYISDDPTAQYHPPVPKAREALMYFTYLQEFYDDHDLADISIFVHPHELAWHTDTALRKSLTFALLQLDPMQVVERGYFNLRTSAGDSMDHDCPNGFYTSNTESRKGEEGLMAPAFLANFPGESLPEMLGGPCCSQFAVSKETILSRPREQYRRSAQFLIDSTWSDQMVGRPWERMWPYLFQRRAMDCNSEWRMLCRMYGVCFKGREEHQRYESLWKEKNRFEEYVGFWRDLWRPGPTSNLRARLRGVNHELEAMLLEALRRGLDWKVREEAGSILTIAKPILD